MRKSLFACLLIALTLVLACFATAGDIKTDIAGHTYTVTLSGTLYEILFMQGPFGPGPCGKAELKADGNSIAMYDFNASGDMIDILNLGKFYYRDWELIWIQGQLLALDGDGKQ
jgi:hypothetical protein